MTCEQVSDQGRSLVPDISHHADWRPTILVHVRSGFHQLRLESLGYDLEHLITSNTGDDAIEDRNEFVWIIIEAHADLDLRSALKREVAQRHQGRPAAVIDTFLKVAQSVCGLDID